MSLEQEVSWAKTDRRYLWVAVISGNFPSFAAEDATPADVSVLKA